MDFYFSECERCESLRGIYQEKKNLNYLLPLTRGILKKLYFKIQYLRLEDFAFCIGV